MNRYLAGLFLAIWWPGVVAFCAPETASGKVPSSSTAVAPSTVSSEPVSGIDKAIQTAQEEVRDPFAITPETKAAVKAAPAAAVAQNGPTITVVLEGIGFGSKDAYALIGGEVYLIGDEKNGIKLVEVRRREVDVLVNGGLMTVPLFPKEELQKVKERADKRAAAKKAVSAQPAAEGLSPVSEVSQTESLQTELPEAPLPGSEKESSSL